MKAHIQAHIRNQVAALFFITVHAVAPLAGLFGVTQDVLTQKAQADANGSFSFSFAPQQPCRTRATN
ncbi:MAG: hypothetical protein I8H70_06565 [Burkholderiales bacterium]|nr:hypothetical protein [Burkholderiales bacterium]